MTATDPRPAPAAKPAARLAPAAAAPAEACAQDMNAAPPPGDPACEARGQAGEAVKERTAICPNRLRNMRHTHAEHDKT